MPDPAKRLEPILFDYHTTQRTDYRDGDISAPIRTVFKEKLGRERPKHIPLKNIHTLVDWAVPNVPFNLFFKPKDVVRTNPYHVQETFLHPEDEGRELAQKTRPRLVMTPAVSMDDVEKHARDMMVKDIYLSTARKSMDEAVLPAKNVRAPFPGPYAPANPITLQKLQPWPVSPEWRMDSVTWDLRQLRAYCEPSKEFWLKRTPKCTVCDATAARVAQKKMEREMKKLS
ncbi:hypothetical protein MSG28_002001 [Choristoneura fumiferana]|uniref:Uncharacterized protein n=1 Tax=Choristoneura fumiferana TaxID=7141 RepID=A0ACC0JTT6_CHOFU|nr:hypothetical protein MSG28_002001 [Choristoneura fumiferana]